MKKFSARELSCIWQDILLAPIPSDVIIEAISIDTRTLKKGDTFVAVSGARFDGHDFVGSAEKAGARHLVVERPQAAIKISQIVVTNTRLALAKLAAQIRKNFTGKVVGLTGSAGKTTSKQMLVGICSQLGKTHATLGNLNNDLGVPLTWFDMPEAVDFVIVEMGANHQGEIAFLADITQPDVAMITNAGEAHLQGFGSLAGVAKGKGELFSALGDNAVAVLNLDDEYAHYWRGLLAEKAKVLTFSLHNNQADVFAKSIDRDGRDFSLCLREAQYPVSLPTTGAHNVMNALGSAACALALGISPTDIVKGLADFKTASGRLQYHERGGVTVIDDTYNANPLSMRAAADTLHRARGYRIMVVGDMVELGEHETQIHEQLGMDLQEKADCFFCLGQSMVAFTNKNPKASHFKNRDRLNEALLVAIKNQPRVTVLVKGSRAMQMERVVVHLLEKLT